MRLLVLSLATAGAAACHGGSGPPDADEALACIQSGRGDTYTIGLERMGTAGRFDVKLMSATPAPPGFNNNTWVIEVRSVTGGVVGAPATGAFIVTTPFMPDHQHGTPIKAKATEMPDGRYSLSPINLWMPGYWETSIAVSVNGASDTVVYKFCIQA